METICIRKPDMALLDQQREALSELIWQDRESILWGLVHFLDVILED